MPYVAWVGDDGGGGPPPGSFTWYHGKHVALGVMPEGSNPATIARNQFFARLAGGVTCEDWEGDDPWGDPWAESFGTLVGVEITRNGVTADFLGSTNPVVEQSTGNGRFNTSASYANEAWCRFHMYTLYVGSPAPQFQMNFDPPIAAWGGYLTDLGDFFGASVYIEIFKSGGGSETYLLHSGSATDGNLDFIGFVDTTGTTYTSIVISAPGSAEDGETGTDVVGLDDIYWCAASGIA